MRVQVKVGWLIAGAFACVMVGGIGAFVLETISYMQGVKRGRR